MKKVHYSIILSTLDMASKIEGINRAVCIKLSEHFSRSEFKAAIRKGDSTAFTCIKGIGEKTVAKIIVGGKRMLALQPERVFVKKKYYMAPMFGTHNTFDAVTQEKLERISKLKYPSTVIRLLEEIASDNERDVDIPFDVTGTVEYNSLSRSALSDDLDIKMRTMTDKVAIYRHNANGVVVLNKKLREQLEAMDEGDPLKTRVFDCVKRVCYALLWRLVKSGIVYNHVPYVFFTCSSGQLKKSSCYVMRADLFKKNQKRYWGGLSPAQIKANAKGAYIPMTKTLQHRALLTSAAVPSSEVFGRPILLENCICIGEFEKNMTANVMSVSAEYDATEGVRDDLNKNMFDGWFALDSRVWGDVAAQTRGYGIKGLGIPVDIHGYCEQRGLAKKIVDIDGVEHDLDKEKNISVILNTSVFKVKKLYGTWANYIAKMKECGFTELYICAVDEEEEETKQLSRQSLQTLFSVTDYELEQIVADSVAEINSLTRLDHARDVLGNAGKDFDDLTNFAKLIRVYPDVIKLPAVQKELRDRYYSLYNKAMYGKVNVNGKFFFVASDPYAWLDIVFGGKAADDPSIGILKANECCCNAYKDAEKLVLLRYPHIFMEWVTVNNRPDSRFGGNVIYVSVHDLVDRVLQMDYDGDHLLVINDPLLVEIAERTRRLYDVPVLYYEPSAPEAPAEFSMEIKDVVECIYKCKQFDKVGQYTNLATTAWSYVNCVAQSPEEIHKMLIILAIITAAVNHAVDAQKTYMLKPLNKALVDLYRQLPRNQVFKMASGRLSEEDYAKADELYLPQGDGVIDRLFDVISPQLSSEYVMRDEDLDFNWRMLEHPDNFGFRCVKNVRVDKKEFDEIGSLDALCLAEKTKLSGIVQAIDMKEPIGLCDYLHLLNCLNASFWKQKRAKDERDENTYEDELKKNLDNRALNDWRNAKIREMIVSFVRAGTEEASNVDDDTVLRYAAKWAIMKTMNNKKKYGIIRFLFDIFGDLYAEAVVENEKLLQEMADVENGYAFVDDARKQKLARHMGLIFEGDAKKTVEPGTACAYLWHMDDVRHWKPGDAIAQLHANVESYIPFDPDAYDVPPVEYAPFDYIIDNELDDLF